MKNVNLEFYNPEATPSIVQLSVSRASVNPIMAWYGSHHEGDLYSVLVDGAEVTLGQNGERGPVGLEHGQT